MTEFRSLTIGDKWPTRSCGIATFKGFAASELRYHTLRWELARDGFEFGTDALGQYNGRQGETEYDIVTPREEDKPGEAIDLKAIKVGDEVDIKFRSQPSIIRERVIKVDAHPLAIETDDHRYVNDTLVCIVRHIPAPAPADTGEVHMKPQQWYYDQDEEIAVQFVDKFDWLSVPYIFVGHLRGDEGLGNLFHYEKDELTALAHLPNFNPLTDKVIDGKHYRTVT